MQPTPTALTAWCSQQLGAEVSLQALPGDAGQRRYYRLHNKNMLAVEAPPASEKNREWLNTQQLLNRAAVRVPEIYHHNLDEGFWLIEDLGDELFYTVVSACDESEIDTWYERCIEVLLRIQASAGLAEANTLPAFDREAFVGELSLFNDWFLSKLLGGNSDANYMRHWDSLCGIIATECEAYTLVPQHGDYQSRNLILSSDNELAVIDFQDATWGSPAYDLSSLLKDCYLKLPRKQVYAAVERYINKAIDSGVMKSSVDKKGFVRHFDLIGLQRHLRVLGTFARLHLRDKKSAYLQHMPRIMMYIDEVMEGYEELSVFTNDWRHVRSLAEQKSWSDYS